MVVLQSRPLVIELLEPSPANPDRPAGLERKGPRVIGSAHGLDGGVDLEQVLTAAAQLYDDVSAMPTRPPQTIVVVSADRGRQAPGLGKEVDRRRLPIVAREKYRVRSFFRRQRLIGTADRGREFAPAEHFGIELR